MTGNTTKQGNKAEYECRAEEATKRIVTIDGCEKGISNNHEFKLALEDITLIARRTKEALARITRK